MSTQVPLPANVRRWLDKNTHPGLALDKYVESWDPHADGGKLSEAVQRPAAQKVVALSQGPPDLGLFQSLVVRRRRELESQNARLLRAVTAGPLTLHLARASALENAGICLHPIHGFVYLPGTGLKGMARAYATEVWLPTQADQAKAKGQIEAVFGNRPGEPNKECQRAGAVVFHDAWPASWPRLQMDILNSHHSQYYQGKEPPGDWDSPIPVYFLSVPARQAFEFALSPRHSDVDPDLLHLARQWLAGALTHLGAGAKTNAGYGAFRLDGDSDQLRSAVDRVWADCKQAGDRDEFACTLELVTPAFLAGADQDSPDGCDLRPATLRGLLRWWWRAMHAGYVDVETLRRLEAALWGDTRAGGAIQLTVRPRDAVKPERYDKHAAAREHKLPRPDDRKTTQGLWYHTYGMHDGGKQRHYLAPGSSWELLIRCRGAAFVRADRGGKPLEDTRRPVSAEVALEQAKAALWWFCVLGGAGSKSRKGFGNFASPENWDQYYGARFVSIGRRLRDACGLPDQGFAPNRADSPALRQMVDLGRRVTTQVLGPDMAAACNGWIELPLNQDDPWKALDQVGSIAQRFAKGYKHRREKQGLGLPRRIGHPARGDFRPGRGVRDRHSSPVLYHLHREGPQFFLRVAAFPASRLPDLAESERLLHDLLAYFLEQ